MAESLIIRPDNIIHLDYKDWYLNSKKVPKNYEIRIKSPIIVFSLRNYPLYTLSFGS